MLKRLITLLMILPMSACALSGGPLSGVVLDETTNEPIADAIVVAQWEGHVSVAWVDSQRICFHVLSTTTDKKGRYHFPAWRKQREGRIFDREVYVTPYKSGYQWSSVKLGDEHTQYLVPFSGTREAHLQFLERVARGTGCNVAGESERNLYPLYEQVYYDAKALSVTSEEIEKLQWFRRVAAYAATARESSMTGKESLQLIEDYLQDHLQ